MWSLIRYLITSINHTDFILQFFFFILDWQGSFFSFSLFLSLLFAFLLLSFAMLHSYTILFFTECVNAYQIDKFYCMLLWTENIITFIIFSIRFCLEWLQKVEKSCTSPLYAKVGFWKYNYWIVNLKPVFKREHQI